VTLTPFFGGSSHLVGRPAVSITFSAGIALAGEKVNQAVGAADQAMYRAKESGRDQWAWALRRIFEPRANSSPLERGSGARWCLCRL